MKRQKKTKELTPFEKDNVETLDKIASNVAIIDYINSNVRAHEDGGSIANLPLIVWDHLKWLRTKTRKENNRLLDQLRFKYRA